MPDQKKSTLPTPRKTPEEQKAQRILRDACLVIKMVKTVLGMLYASLPDSPEAEAMGEGRIPESLTYAIRGDIECCIADQLNPALQTLRRAARESPAKLYREWQERQAGEA